MARFISIATVLIGMGIVWFVLVSQGALPRRSLGASGALMGGLFAVAGGGFNWEWFMTDPTAWPVVEKLGRTGARVFYVVAGVILSAAGVWMVNDRAFLGLER